ncbi:hypothetical protein V6N13_014059 [Hibiscus sabdariffa]
MAGTEAFPPAIGENIIRQLPHACVLTLPGQCSTCILLVCAKGVRSTSAVGVLLRPSHFYSKRTRNLVMDFSAVEFALNTIGELNQQVRSLLGVGRNVEERMEELGKEMVEHCAGLPLAIVVLGGILVTKDSVNEWQMVSDNVISYLKRGKGHGVEEVLELSYDDLPHYLRPCFLYLANFPEDFEIQVDRLIQLWVAEGIVFSEEEDGNGGSITEDLAERYLMELVERCMVQARERDAANLKIKIVQMHDLMRNLCLSKAKQENFLCFVDQSNASSISTIRRIHRVSAPNILWTKCIKSPNLRSILFFGEISDESIHRMKLFRKPVLRKMTKTFWVTRNLMKGTARRTNVDRTAK